MDTSVQTPDQSSTLMTQALLPECIVCFQPYDHELNIPRVLSCGHSFCEPCLHELQTTWQILNRRVGEDLQSSGILRCPECNHRTRLPLGGQKFLPKNVALLRLLPNSSGCTPIEEGIHNLKARSSKEADGRAKRVDVSSRNRRRRPTGQREANLEVLCGATSSSVHTSMARILHNPIFSSSLRLDSGRWDVGAWILPQEVIHLKENTLVNSSCRLLYGEIIQEQGWPGSRISVSLLRIERRKSEGSKTTHSDVDWCKDEKGLEAERSKNAEKSYEQLLLELAEGFDYETKIEISLLFRISSICHRICKTVGLWMNEKQELYLVSESPGSGEESPWDVLKGCRIRSWSKDRSARDLDAVTLSEESLGQSSARAELEVLTSIVVCICEVLLEVHAQGLILGLLSRECLVFDQFDNLLLDTNTALGARHLLQETTSGFKGFTSAFKAGREDVVDEDIPVSSGEEDGTAELMSTADNSYSDTESNDQRNIYHGGNCWEYMSPEMLGLLTSNMLRAEDEDEDEGASSEDAFLSTEDVEARINSKTDVWSLGCIILELITGKSPYAGSDFNQVLKDVLDEEGKPKSLQSLALLEHGCDTYLCLGLDDHLLNLLQRCFQYDPKERADVYEILQGFKELQLSSFAYKNRFARRNSKNKAKSVDQKNWILCLPGFGVDGWFEYERKAQAQKQETQEIIEQTSEAPRAEVSQAEGEESQIELEPLEECFMELKGSLEGHRDDVTALIICGNYLLSSSFDKTIRVWSLEGYQLLKTLEGHHTQVILALAMDVDSLRCFSGDQSGRICAWRLEEEVETPLTASWQEHNDWRYTGVASLTVSGDGLLYSGSGDRTIKAWSSQSFELLGTMEGHKALVSSLVVDGELLYSGSWDGVIRVWWRDDHSPMAVLSTSDPMMGGVRSLCLSSGMLFAGRDDGSIQVWMNEEYLTAVSAHKMVVSSLCVEGPFLYSGSWDHSVKAWRIDEITSNPLPALDEECGCGMAALASNGSNLYVALMKSVKIYSIFSSSSASSSSPESSEQEETG